MGKLIRMLQLLALAPAAPLLAQAQPQQSGVDKLEDKAESVVRQPVKDIGLLRENPPEILINAQRAPYSLAGVNSCTDLRREIAALTEVMGPDIDEVDEKGDPLVMRLGEAGVKSVVNALIPFRSLVREASGAAESERKFRVMVAAGMARRGYLKGIARERACKV
jgi:hypothetical protein